jgi:flagellar hook-associated protein 3 FlgL
VTTPRITERSAALGSLAGLQSSASRLAALQSQLSSGRQITKPSDDPVGTERALALRGDLKRANQYAANASSGLGWLSQVDGTMTGIMNQMQNVRTLVLQGLNTGTNDATSTAAIADNVDQLRSSMLSLANTTFEGRPIFGGTTTGSVAFDSSGAYIGDANAVTRQVGANDDVQINQTGSTVFGANGSNLFDLLSTVSSDLRSNPSGLQGDLSQIDTAMSTLSAQQGTAGATYQRINTVQNNIQTTSLQVTTELSSLQDADVATMAIQISSANLAYQAALQTTASIRQTSLLDYLH